MLVKEAAVMLDRTNPGWHRQVDPETLNLNSNVDCVLGQIYGSYITGLITLQRAGAVTWIGADSPFINFHQDKETQWLTEIFERRCADSESAVEQRELVAA